MRGMQGPGQDAKAAQITAVLRTKKHTELLSTYYQRRMTPKHEYNIHKCIIYMYITSPRCNPVLWILLGNVSVLWSVKYYK